MPAPSLPRERRAVVAILAVAALFPTYQALARPLGAGTDLFMRWVGVQAILAGGDPYSSAFRSAVAAAIAADPTVRADFFEVGFNYPPTVAWMLLPFVWLPLAWANAAWLVFSEALFWSGGYALARTRNVPHRLELLLLASFFGPVFEHRFLVQLDMAFVGLSACVVALAVRGRKLGWALAPLCLGKPQIGLALLLTLVVWALAQKKWRELALLAAMTVVVVAPTFVLLPGWLAGFAEDARRYASTIEAWSLLRAIAAGPTLARVAGVAVIVALAAVARASLARGTVVDGFALALLVKYVAFPSTGTYGAVALLVPAIVWSQPSTQAEVPPARSPMWLALIIASWIPAALVAAGLVKPPLTHLFFVAPVLAMGFLRLRRPALE